MFALRKTLRACWDVLPIEFRANIKATSDTIKLDYASKDLYLQVASLGDVFRATSCRKEPETVRWIERDVRGVLYDIGANVGAYSLVAWARDATVIAFEPGFATFTQLCRNILLNGCGDRVTPLNLALSDQSRLMHFRYNDVTGGAASHVGLAADDVARQSTAPVMFTQPMWAYALDDAIEKFGLAAPNHIKIDVDGHELEVLRGARRTLELPELQTIQIEIDEQDPPAIRSLLASSGFTVKHVAPHAGGSLADYVFAR